ncbi:MAG: hypothetical protein IKD69_15525 [Solobacterium sp.]|nr:hypothetical protein [Solobacterium sp.]
MLGKMITYDVRATSRRMLPLIAVFLGLTVLSILMWAIPNTLGLAAVVITFLWIMTGTFSLFVGGYSLVRYFYSKMYGNEAYLTHTLPVKAWVHVAAKTITTVLWVLALSAIVALAAVAFIFATGINNSITELLNDPSILFYIRQIQINGSNLALLLTEATVSVIATIHLVYAAIAIGQQWSDHPIGGACIAGLLMTYIRNLVSTFTINGMNNGMDTFGPAFSRIMWINLAFAVIQIIIYDVIIWFLNEKRLNLQ